MKTLGSIESFTGGLFASSIVAHSGASKFFKGSLVTYAAELKEKFGIDISFGLVSKETAISMALKGKEILNVDYCIAFTGNAGPTTLDSQKVGKAFIAINEQVYECNFAGTRNQIRNQAVKFALLKWKEIIGETNE